MGRPARLALAASVILLAACATSYKPESVWNGGGFSEARRAPGVYQVWFVGNERTSPAKTEDLALLRGADLCLADRKSFMRVSQLQTGSVLQGYARGRDIPPPARTAQVDSRDAYNAYMRTQTQNKPQYDIRGEPLYTTRSGLEVGCSTEQADGAQDAAAVAATIRKRYDISTPN